MFTHIHGTFSLTAIHAKEVQDDMNAPRCLALITTHPVVGHDATSGVRVSVSQRRTSWYSR